MHSLYLRKKVTMGMRDANLIIMVRAIVATDDGFSGTSGTDGRVIGGAPISVHLAQVAGSQGLSLC
jgi:hypothetical protein